MRKLFTSESVTKGHPDKMCDYISDSILDEYLKEDAFSRVAVETIATKGEIIVTGEITSKAKNVDIKKIVRECVKEIGYDNEKTDIDYKSCKVHINISKQSEDIKMGVDKSLEIRENEEKTKNDKMFKEGAGDQGIMFGFATNETENYLPLPIYYAHKLAKRLEDVRKESVIDYLRPDGKTQVTVEYQNGAPVGIDTIVVSTQHSSDVSLDKIREDIISYVIKPIIPAEYYNDNIKIYVNPTGRFVVGGPMGDSGLTGRKIIVDTYGGYSRHGGGAFSGKDPTKVDRTGAYAARYIAKNVVAAGLADKCEVQLAYAIGVAKPVSVMIDTFGTAKCSEEAIEKAVIETVDLRPAAIIERFGLRRPIYKQLAAYGHMGREDLDIPWEKTDIALKLSDLVK